MKKLLMTSLLLGAGVLSFSGFSGCHATTTSQEAKVGPETAKIDNSEARKAQILANLKAKYATLATLDPQLGEFRAVASGMQAVEMTLQTPQGEQKQTLLLTPDNKSLFMVLEGPIDVSRDAKAIAAEKAKKQQERVVAIASAIKGATVRGEASAPVTIVEFTDFQCPYCGRAYGTLEEVIKKYEKQVKVIYMPYPLPFHPWAKPAAVAAACAEQQSAEGLWALYHGYFKNQTDVTAENLIEKSKGFLADSKIDVKVWESCVNDTESENHKKAAKSVDDAMEAGGKQGVNGTPAFFINGEMLSGAQPMQAFAAAIDGALKAAQK